jgi:hypothetical protein
MHLKITMKEAVWARRAKLLYLMPYAVLVVLFVQAPKAILDEFRGAHFAWQRQPGE